MKIKIRVWEKGCKSLDDVYYLKLPIDSACYRSQVNFYPGG